MKEETVTLKKSTIWQISTGVLALLLIISISTGGFGNDGSGSGNDAAPTNNQPPSAPSGIGLVNAEDYMDDDPVMGDPDAPLTIVEFSDYQCPFCARFKDQTLGLLKEQYIDTGKVKFIYRDLPLDTTCNANMGRQLHPFACKAAEASECADEQGKFWEYHDLIFAGQGSLSIESLKQWASDLSLDTNKFNDCLDSGKYEDEVINDLNDASAIGGSGTPFFLVGEIPLSGAQPFSEFQKAIEAQL